MQRMIRLTDGPVALPVPTSREVIILESMGYEPFDTFQFRALVKPDTELDEDGGLDARSISLGAIRDHIAVLLQADPEDTAARLDPGEFGSYFKAILELGSHYWGGGEDAPFETTDAS